MEDPDGDISRRYSNNKLLLVWLVSFLWNQDFVTLNFPYQETFLSRSDKWKSFGRIFCWIINYICVHLHLHSSSSNVTQRLKTYQVILLESTITLDSKLNYGNVSLNWQFYVQKISFPKWLLEGLFEKLKWSSTMRVKENS